MSRKFPEWTQFIRRGHGGVSEFCQVKDVLSCVDGNFETISLVSVCRKHRELRWFQDKGKFLRKAISISELQWTIAAQ